MTLKIEVKDKGFKRAKKLLAQPRKTLELGVLENEAMQEHPTRGVSVGQVAGWMEYGTPEVPARSWLNDWFDENAHDIFRQLATDTLRVLIAGEDEKFALQKRGTMYRRQMVQRIEDIPGNWRPLKQSTITKKGGLDTPLIDTETLIDSIKWRVE